MRQLEEEAHNCREGRFLVAEQKVSDDDRGVVRYQHLQCGFGYQQAFWKLRITCVYPRLFLFLWQPL